MTIIAVPHVSGNVMQRVYDVIHHCPGITCQGIVDVLGFPHDTVRRAIARMRDRFDTDRSGKGLRYTVRPGAERPIELRGSFHLKRRVAA